jgi:hypothetical protein
MGANLRRPKHKRHKGKKVEQSCPTAFLVPAAPHSGSAASSLTAAQFAMLSRDAVDSGSSSPRLV